MPDEFKIGDVVVAKTGSPRMTVVRLKGKTSVACAWHCWYGLPQENSYPIHAIILDPTFQPSRAT